MKHSAIVVTVLFALVHAVGVVADPELIRSGPLAAKQASAVYIVQLRENPIAAYSGGVAGIAATKPAPGAKIDVNAANVRQYFAHLEQQHDRVMAEVGASEKIYGYCYSFNGFAARLGASQVEALRAHPDVARVWKDELRHPLTDNTPDYLDITGGGGPWRNGLTGEDIVVGIIDSGIWPEHPSFADEPTPRFGDKGKRIPYGPPPASWTGTDCAFGNDAYNPLDADFECNNKLLAASFFVDGFAAASPLLPEEYLSARDQDGHGSHVGSTAAGNARVPAQIAGERLGRVSGMAPRARIAAYKICWNGSLPPDGFQGGCFSSDAMRAIDQAVADGVDVINYSIGGASTAFGGPDDIAFLFAADAGVFVAAAQGNDGPAPQTTGTPAGVPWLTSVGAGQDDDVFNLGVEVASSAADVSGVYEAVEGPVSVPVEQAGPVMAPLVVVDDGTGATGNQGCGPLVNGAAIAGNIALVSRGACAFSTKILNAQAAGAAGVVVFNNAGDPISMGGDPTGIALPAVMIGQTDGELLQATLLAGESADAVLSADIRINKADSVAIFSSRGPNGGSPDIIKPDVTAPGVDILAAQTPTPNDGQAPGELFQIISGTSMASPHVAGIGALLRQAHRDWTPEMIRSALMTTADPRMTRSFGDAQADPFDVGAGLVDVRRALEPGLVYQTGLIDYLRYLCGEPLQAGVVPAGLCGLLGALDPSDLNLPSIGIGALAGTQTVTRTVTSVVPGKGRDARDGDDDDDDHKHGKRSKDGKPARHKPTTFRAHVDPPAGIEVSVSPDTLTLAEGESATYEVQFTVTPDATVDQFTFGRVEWRGRAGKDRLKGSDDDGDKDDDRDKDSDRDNRQLVVSSPIAVRPVAAAFPDEVAATGAGADGALTFDVKAGFPGIIDTMVAGLTAPEIQTLDDGAEVGGATLHFFFVPPGTRYTRFALFDDSVGDGTGADDLDLQIQGPDSLGFPLVDFSGSPTSQEEVNLVDPIPGLYAAFVIRFATVNAVTPYDLHAWNVGADEGNLSATSPGPVAAGDVVSVDVAWNGLAPATRYRGLVSISNEAGEIGFTVLSVDTAP